MYVGCSEKNVPYVVDEDELIRYITETAEGKELFDVNGVVTSDPYGFPFDAAVYVDSVISHERTFEFHATPNVDTLLIDYGYLGRLREAQVFVTDHYIIQTTKTLAPNVYVDTTERALTRTGFFLKLGDDAEDYVGWVLWGFNGIYGGAPSVVARLERFDGSSFSGDYSIYRSESLDTLLPVLDYLRLINFDTVVVGSRLVVKLSRSSSATNYPYYVLNGRDTSGLFQHEMHVQDTLSFDTVRTPKSNHPYYNLLYVHEFDHDRFRYRRSWCIPYRQ